MLQYHLSMESQLSIILTLIIGFLVVILFIHKSSKKQTDTHLVEWLKSMQQSVDASSKNVHGALQQSTSSLNERLDNAARVIAGVQKNIGEMSEIGRSMRDLQDLLKSPKLRGNIGEQGLKKLL